jgi:hypothetical protein
MLKLNLIHFLEDGSSCKKKVLPEEKRPLGKCRRRCKYNTEMDLREIEVKGCKLD